jgi:FSR family fosmidomycin resistance protein-like MFS transporter
MVEDRGFIYRARKQLLRFSGGTQDKIIVFLSSARAYYSSYIGIIFKHAWGQHIGKSRRVWIMSRRSGDVSVLFFIGSTHFLIHVLSQLLPAVLPVIRSELDLTLTQASLLISIPLLVGVFAYLPVGFLSGKNGTLILTLSFVLIAAGGVIIPLAGSYGIILLGFGLLGLGQTMYHPPALKVAGDIEPKKLGFAMGVQMAGGSLGSAVGPITLGLILLVWGWRAGFIIWVPVILLGAVYSLNHMRRITKPQSLDESQATLRRVPRSLLNRGFLMVVILSAVMEASSMILLTYVTSYLTGVMGITASLASVIFGVGALLGIAGCLLGGVAGDRFGRYKSIMLVMALMATSVALIPVFNSFILVALFFVIWRGLNSATMPLMNSLVVSHSESETRAMAFSVNFLVSNLADALVPVAASIAIEGQLGVIFPVSVLILLPGIVIALYLGRLAKREDGAANNN